MVRTKTHGGLFRTSMLLAAVGISLSARNVVAQDGATVRSATRAWREGREAAILREYRALLSIPNVASDSVNIRRNAAALMEMLRRRGATAQLLEVPGAPPAVYGSLSVPGAQRTVVL